MPRRRPSSASPGSRPGSSRPAGRSGWRGRWPAQSGSSTAPRAGRPRPPLRPAARPRGSRSTGASRGSPTPSAAASCGAPRRGPGRSRRLREPGPTWRMSSVAAGAVWTASSADGTVRVLDAGRAPAGPARRRAARSRSPPTRAASSPPTRPARSSGSRRARAVPDGPPVLLGGAPVDVALDGDRAWVADAARRDGASRRAQLRARRPGRARRDALPVAIAADARGRLRPLPRRPDARALDASTGAVRSRMPLDPRPDRPGPRFAAHLDRRGNQRGDPR